MANTKGKLQIAGLENVTDLRVLDANYREVAAGINQLQVELEQGIYLVQAAVPGDRVEKLVAIESESTSIVSDFDLHYESSIPLEAVRSATKYHRLAAESYSTRVPITLGDSATARLFIFIRTLNGGKRTECPNFTIHSQDSNLSFPEFGVFDLNEGWIALTMDLRPGIYIVEQEVPQFGKRSQALFLEENWETQIFAPWDVFPDFARATIYMCRRGSGFDPSLGRNYGRIEAALNGLARGRLLITPDDFDALIHENFDNPILGIIACYALLDQPEVDYGRLHSVTSNMRRLLPHSPDIELISLLVKRRDLAKQPLNRRDLELSELPSFENPPLFAKGTEHLMRLAAVFETLCPADSWLAGISIRLTTGSTWTRWDSSIDVLSALKRLYDNLRALQEEEFDLSAPSLAQRLQLPLSVVDREIRLNMKSLYGFNSVRIVHNESRFLKEVTTKQKRTDTKKVFIVSTKDSASREINRFLIAIGLIPVTWEEAISQTGRDTPSIKDILIAAFEIAQVVIVLLNSKEVFYEDSVNYLINLDAAFIAGMAVNMQPKRTILITLGNMKLPDSMSNFIGVELNNEIERRQELIQTLQTAKGALDLSKEAWRTEGNFVSI